MTPLLTVAEAAELLGVSRSTVYTQMDAGKLPYVKIGRARRIKREAIERYIDSHEIGSEAAAERDSQSSGQFQVVAGQ